MVQFEDFREVKFHFGTLLVENFISYYIEEVSAHFIIKWRQPAFSLVFPRNGELSACFESLLEL